MKAPQPARRTTTNYSSWSTTLLMAGLTVISQSLLTSMMIQHYCPHGELNSHYEDCRINIPSASGWPPTLGQGFNHQGLEDKALATNFMVGNTPAGDGYREPRAPSTATNLPWPSWISRPDDGEKWCHTRACLGEAMAVPGRVSMAAMARVH